MKFDERRRGWARKKRDRQRGEKRERNGKKDGRIGALVHRWRLTKEESLGETGSHTGTSWRETSANERRSSPFGMPFGEDTTMVSGNRSICIRREMRAVNFFPRREIPESDIREYVPTRVSKSPRITLQLSEVDFSLSLSRLINGISPERRQRE